jgi:hypothetical protein
MAWITVENAIDMHAHTYPCIFPRVTDDWGFVESARTAGMQALVLKCHHESTVSRAYLISQKVSGIRVFGGIVLNSFVGGINPAAVEAALRLGGKTVWMPTIDAGFHGDIYGYTGSYDHQKGSTQGGQPGIRILQDGKLTPETEEVIRLIAHYGANLGTSHLSPEEICALVHGARAAGVEKILIMHPLFKVPRMPWPIIEEVVAAGALLEIDYCGISPMWAEVKLDDLVKLVKAFGADRCILVSDGGQTHNPLPCDALRLLAQNLHEKGVTEVELERMMVTTPQQLLGL